MTARPKPARNGAAKPPEALGAPVEAFPHPQRTSLAETIADTVAEAIATRHLQPGERIVETALAERLGVSRVPIREALKVLHAQGILAGGGHKGYRVAAFGPDTIGKVVEVRLTLETFLLRDAIAQWRAGAGSPTVLDGPIRDMDMSARAGDSRASLRADLAFHRAIRRAAGNEVAGTLWDTIARHVAIYFALEHYRDDDLAAVTRQHRALRDLIVAQVARPGTAEDIRRAMEDHLLQVARAKGAKPRQAARGT